MSRLLDNVLPGLFLLFSLCLGALGSEGFNCSKTLRDSGVISPARPYYEAVLGTEQVLTCRVCKYWEDSVMVSWLRDGATILQSGRVHYSHSEGEEFSLRLRSLSASDLGNYTCSLSLAGSARHLDSATIILDKRPPPPLFVGLQDGVNQTSQLLSWTGESRMPIIHFLLEFRLSPLAGAGEDWVSLVIPYDGQTRVQSYLLRGLTTATSYQARIRTKTRHGVSSYSPIWQIAAGFIIIVVEAPFCCMFLDFVAAYAEMVEKRPPWQKAALYVVLSLPPLFLCLGLSTLIGSGAICATGVFYGMQMVGKKASPADMAAAARGNEPDEKNIMDGGDEWQSHP